MKSTIVVVAVLCIVSALSVPTQCQTGLGSSSRPHPDVQTKPNAPQPASVLEYKGKPGSPLSEVVRVGQMLYLSGQLGVNASGGLASGGIKEETKQVMENIRGVLERNGSGMDQVVKCTVMLLDIADRPAMNEVYTGYFPKDRMPARSTFGTTGLALGAKVEIECMAAVK